MGNPSLRNVAARYAYTSTYFRICVEFADKFDLGWYVLSAKHGLINPDFIITRDYDATISSINSKTVLIRKMSRQATLLNLTSYSKVISLCGSHYNAVLTQATERLGIDIAIPFPRDMRSIGLRQKWLRRCIDRDELPFLRKS